ncbi:MAG: hypothetical protein HY835_04270 [Anaerolineae bacterium]|nr:hypothetical protein [Anaerolineae bacterium]
MKIQFDRLFLLLMLALILAVPSGAASARSNQDLIGPISDVWRSGVQVNGSPTYAAVSGRARSLSAQFSSAAGESFFLVEAPAQKMVVRAARVRILKRSGAYAQHATLVLEARSLDGTLQRTLSTVKIDLQTAPTTDWIAVDFTGDPKDNWLNPGEALTFHFALDDVAGGDLSALVIFEVSASDLPHSYIFPIIWK